MLKKSKSDVILAGTIYIYVIIIYCKMQHLCTCMYVKIMCFAIPINTFITDLS